MITERPKSVLEQVWYLIRRGAVVNQTATIDKVCKLNEQLALNPKQGAVFRDYFAATYAMGGGNLSQVENVIHSPQVEHAVRRTSWNPFRWIDRAFDVNFEVARELLKSAEQKSQDPSVLGQGDPIKDAASQLANAYIGLNNRHATRDEKIRALNDKVAQINLRKNRLG